MRREGLRIFFGKFTPSEFFRTSHLNCPENWCLKGRILLSIRYLAILLLLPRDVLRFFKKVRFWDFFGTESAVLENSSGRQGWDQEIKIWGIPPIWSFGGHPPPARKIVGGKSHHKNHGKKREIFSAYGAKKFLWPPKTCFLNDSWGICGSFFIQNFSEFNFIAFLDYYFICIYISCFHCISFIIVFIHRFLKYFRISKPLNWI